jgi:hypothetical protein
MCGIASLAKRLSSWPLALLVIAAALLVPSSALATPFTNSAMIMIPDGPASPYGSPITPTGLTGVVGKVTVTLHGYTHSFLSDVDVLVVAPNNVGVVIMSDACTFFQTTAPIDLTFDDDAVAVMPPSGCLVIPANLKPFNNAPDNPQFDCDLDPDVFPAPAPPGPTMGGYPPGVQMLSTFNGISAAVAMGTWKLFVLDDCATETGSINSGWTLDITMNPTAVTVLSFSARARAGQVDLSWRTASETGMAGFNVFRTGPLKTVKVNRGLIKAVGVFGGNYRLVDRTARSGVKYSYRLQIVYRDGRRAWDRTIRAVAQP